MMLRSLSIALVLSALVSPLASAQERPPQECGMTEETAQYGPVQPGAVVTLQRHRFVGGDDNWDEQMTRWLGRAARVTRVSGVDAAGCPGVRVDVDGQEWFWRARDLGLGTGPQPRPVEQAPSASGIPQECGQDEARPSYGPAVPGAEVVLGRHRMVNGDDNWADEMMQFVGRRARIVEQSGLDSAGCAGARVDVDGQQWFWRVRDMRTGSGGATEPGTSWVASTGVSSDHGRPSTVVAWGAGGAGAGTAGAAGSGLFGSGGAQPVQECGMTDATVQWGPIAVGTAVVPGVHRDVNGDTNWSPEMQAFVGAPTRITELIGVDDQGCGLVRIESDRGQFVWRTRDMTLP